MSGASLKIKQNFTRLLVQYQIRRIVNFQQRQSFPAAGTTQCSISTHVE